MLKWIKNSKTNYQTKTGYKGITITNEGRYKALLSVSLSDKRSKITKNIHIGIYDTIEEAKKARVNYILSLI